MSGRVGPLKPSFINTYSLAFDGVDDYVDCGNSAALKPNIITVSCWIKGSTQTAYTRIISQDGPTGGADAYGFYVTPALNKVVFAIKTDVTGTVTSATSGVVLDNSWHHLVGTYDGSEVILYVDGVAVGSPSPGTSILSYGIGGLTIGCFSEPTSLPSYLFNGNIDEVSIFNSVIPIGNLWDGSGKPTDLTSLSPIAWYRMGDNGSYKSPQFLIPNNENKDKVSNYSFEFDGMDDYLNLGNGVSFEYTDSFSYSFWVKPNAVSGPKNLYTKYDAGRGIYTYLNSVSGAGSNILYFFLLNTNSGTLSGRKRITTNTGAIIPPNVWTNIVITYDGSGLGSGINVYKNGVSQTVTVTQDSLQNQTIVNTVDSYLCAFNGISSFYPGGQDEFAIFNTELSSADALAIYNGGEPTTLPSGAVAHYKMGEEATFVYNVNPDGTWTIPDQVGSNDGTSNNQMADSARVGTAPSSSNNALSFNMDLIDRVTDVPT